MLTTAIPRMKGLKKSRKQCIGSIDLSGRPLQSSQNNLKRNVGLKNQGHAALYSRTTNAQSNKSNVVETLRSQAQAVVSRQTESTNVGAGLKMFYKGGKGRGRDNAPGNTTQIRTTSHGKSGRRQAMAFNGDLSIIQREAQQQEYAGDAIVGNLHKGERKTMARRGRGNQITPLDMSDGHDAISTNNATAESASGSSAITSRSLQTEYATNPGTTQVDDPFLYRNIAKNSIKESYIRIGADSGQATSSKFEKYQPHQLSGQITEHMKITGNSGKQHVPIYEQYRQTKQLDPKIKTEGVSGKSHLPKYEKYHNMKRLNNPTLTAKNVTSSKSTSLNNSSVKAEHFVRLSPNKPAASTAPQNRINAVINPNKDNFKIRHKRPDVSQFSSNSMARIPQF